MDIFGFKRAGRGGKGRLFLLNEFDFRDVYGHQKKKKTGIHSNSALFFSCIKRKKIRAIACPDPITALIILQMHREGQRK